MINFADEWTVGELAKYRQSKFYDEAHEYRRRKDARNQGSAKPGLRLRVGLTMIRAGEQILGT